MVEKVYVTYNDVSHEKNRNVPCYVRNLALRCFGCTPRRTTHTTHETNQTQPSDIWLGWHYETIKEAGHSFHLQTIMIGKITLIK